MAGHRCAKLTRAEVDRWPLGISVTPVVSELIEGAGINL